MIKLKYDSNAIQHLEGIEAIRKRPGMYIGSVGPEGVLHITKEIISNAIDEYLAGFCTEIIVKVKDGIIIVVDNGRGIPIGKMDNGMNTLEAVFTLLHTGAKFNSDGSTGYNSSGGMNGVGAKATNALSEYLKVIVYRDNKKHTMTFERGKKTNYIIENSEIPNRTGTIVEFKPDAQIFDSPDIDINALNKMLIEFSYLCKGLTIYLITNTIKRVYKSENGIYDYVKILNKNNPITDIFYVNHTEGNIGIEVALMYTDAFYDSVKLYTNNIPNTGGTHLTGFKIAFTRKINEYARANKLLKDKDDNLTGEELREGMNLIINIKMPNPVFNGQTKDVLTSAEGRTIVETLINQEIDNWFKASPNSVKAIIEKALLTRKAREAAKKAKETVRKKSIGYNSILPTKLADCSSINADECELYIVEGV